MKQFILTSYYDEKKRGVEDSISINWIDETDYYEWIWKKASKGYQVVVNDMKNGLTKEYGLIEWEDEDVKDLEV